MIKPVPYFPFYAANTIADRSYRLMSLSERGLWISLYLECWVNTNVPCKPAKLAKILGIGDKEVESGLTENVMHYFQTTNDQLHSPELDGYRANFEAKRKAQSDGGFKGATSKKRKIKDGSCEELKESNLVEGQPIGLPSSSLNSFKSNSFKSNSLKSNSFVGKEVPVVLEDPWIKECFGDTEESKEYQRQSRGG